MLNQSWQSTSRFRLRWKDQPSESKGTILHKKRRFTTDKWIQIRFKYVPLSDIFTERCVNCKIMTYSVKLENNKPKQI